MKNILIVIDDVEFKYFEFNKLVTNFWFIYEYLNRGYNVFVALKSGLFQKNNIPFAICYKTFLIANPKVDIKKEEKEEIVCLNNFDIIFFRPDPPVDIDYINATYILSYVNDDVLIINKPQALREKNEKLYVNEFQGFIPENVVSANEKVIKEFLFKEKEIIIKPTNRCFGSGVFYLNDKDKNINTIIQNATNNYKTQVMVQKYLPDAVNGDKRLIYICGKLFDYCVRKVPSNNDFKFNEHNENTLKFAQLSKKDKILEHAIKEKFEHDGIFLAGLDVIDGKIIEINITSPCFFIKEINEIFEINFEKLIIDRIEQYAEIMKKQTISTV